MVKHHKIVSRNIGNAITTAVAVDIGLKQRGNLVGPQVFRARGLKTG